VAKVNAQGTSLDYCGYIGGDGADNGYSIAIDGQGNAYVTGLTTSTEATFPVIVGPDLTYNGGGFTIEAFVAKVNAQGTGLDYCGYIGGNSDDIGHGIVVDGIGNAYVAGQTESSETAFPVTVGPDLTYNGYIDTFIAKIPPCYILLRAGNIAATAINPQDVLFVNGTAGDDCFRTIINPPGNPVSIAMKAPPGGPNPAGFTLYAWPGEAGADDVAEQPFDIGTACFPMPLSNGSPLPPPFTIVNNIGNPMLPGIPQAPTYIVQSKIMNPGTWTLQGIIYDNYSLSGTVSLTNAIVLVQQ
jgi:hypothetical protein